MKKLFILLTLTLSIVAQADTFNCSVTPTGSTLPSQCSLNVYFNRISGRAHYVGDDLSGSGVLRGGHHLMIRSPKGISVYKFEEIANKIRIKVNNQPISLQYSPQGLILDMGRSKRYTNSIK